MSDRSRKSRQTTSRDTPSATSSPASGSGPTPYEGLDGQMTLPFGQGVVRVSRSVRAGNAEAQTMSVISGPHGSGSSESVALTSSLGNRLRARLASAGSTLFQLTWKERVTPSGRVISQLRASARRTSASGSTSSENDSAGWATPDVTLAPRRSGIERKANGKVYTRDDPTLTGQAQLASWPTPKETEHQFTQKRGNLTLNGTAQLASWPTPAATELGNTLESYQAMKANMESGPRTAITHLSQAAQLAAWPSPMDQDCESAARHGYMITGNQGTTLTDAARLALPESSWVTPASRDYKGANSEAHVTTNGTGRMHMDQLANQTVHLVGWPTPMLPNKDAGNSDYTRKIEVAMGIRDSVNGKRLDETEPSGQTPSGSPAGTGKRAQLNPALSRWLQGLPKEWCEAAIRAHRLMPTTRRKRA